MLSESRNLLMEQVSNKMVMLFARQIKQKVRQCYPRPCMVSITLFWARNLSYDVDLDRGRDSKVYLNKKVVFFVFLVLLFFLWANAAQDH